MLLLCSNIIVIFDWLVIVCCPKHWSLKIKMIANFKKTVWRKESSQEMNHCMCCGRVACEDVVLMKCSACKAVVYCSSECQRKDWKTGHKQKCHILRKP